MDSKLKSLSIQSLIDDYSNRENPLEAMAAELFIMQLKDRAHQERDSCPTWHLERIDMLNPKFCLEDQGEKLIKLIKGAAKATYYTQVGETCYMDIDEVEDFMSKACDLEDSFVFATEAIRVELSTDKFMISEELAELSEDLDNLSIYSKAV